METILSTQETNKEVLFAEQSNKESIIAKEKNNTTASKHSNLTSEWGTPKDVIDASRTVLNGCIELDPASCKTFNKFVNSSEFYTKEENSLLKPWFYYKSITDNSFHNKTHPNNVFLNPPSGKLVKQERLDMLAKFQENNLASLISIKSFSLPKLFWQKLIDEIELGHVSHAIYLVYSTEQLQTTQLGNSKALLDYPICFFKKRLSFVDENCKECKQGSHSSAIVYIPNLIDNTEIFKEQFKKFGKVLNC
jgi:hypothetical protein